MQILNNIFSNLGVLQKTFINKKGGKNVAQRYQHFCPIARALEKIGDKWSLLIVRDLLQKPQRFTDLIGSLGKITPRWLTRRLRELEAAGIVEKGNQLEKGRGVLYHLTPAGRELVPVVDALLNWGLRHAMRPPLPGEIVNPGLMMRGLTRALNIRSKHLSRPVLWEMQFPQSLYALSYDGVQWSNCEGEAPNADLIIKTTPEAWAKLSTVHRSERSGLFKSIHLKGSPDRIEEFASIFGMKTGLGIEEMAN